MTVQGYVIDISRNQIFPVSYEAARIMMIKSGKMVGVKLRKVILNNQFMSPNIMGDNQIVPCFCMFDLFKKDRNS